MAHQVNIATGEVTSHAVDLRLPGYIPLVLSRTYRSGALMPGPFGFGWRINLDAHLRFGEQWALVRDFAGREVLFEAVPVGKEVKDAASGLTLQHHEDRFVAFSSPVLRMVFEKRDAHHDVIPLDRMEDLNGNRIRFFYSGPRLTRLVDTLGRRVVLTYSGDVISAIHVEDHAGSPVFVKSFRYDDHGDLVATVNATRHETTYRYEDHLLVSSQSRLGGMHHVQYDEARRGVALWQADGVGGHQFAYDDVRGLTRVLALNGLQTIYLRNGKHQILKQIDPFGNNQYYHYDSAHQFVGYSAEGQARVTFQRVVQHDEVLLQVGRSERAMSLHFNDAGLLERVSDVFKNTYALGYDDRGNLVGLTTPSGAVWMFGRDAGGAVTEVVSPEQRKVHLRRGSSGRELTVEDGLGLCYRERYTMLGQLTERVDALGHRQHRGYDAMHRLSEVIIEDQYRAGFSYDASGHLVRYTDSQGNRCTLEYTPSGTLHAYAGPRGDVITFGYDQAGGLIAATNEEGKTAHLAYDTQGNLRRMTFFDGRVETYAYEERGITVCTQHASGETLRSYNAHLDLLGEALPDGGRRQFQYDAQGSLRAVESDEARILFQYDEEGRIAELRKGPVTLTFSHDSDGNLVAVQDGEKHRVELRYDERSRVQEVLDDARASCRFSYDKADRLTMLREASGRQVVFEYDALDRLLERRLLDGEGRLQEHHRFTDEPVEERLNHPLPTPPGSTGQESHDEREAVAFLLRQSRHGMTLVVKMSDIWVPVWVQDDYWHRGGTGLTARIVWGCMYTSDGASATRRPLNGLERLRLWRRGPEQSISALFTEVPRSLDLGKPWATLDLFFLRRMFSESRHPMDTLDTLARQGLGRVDALGLAGGRLLAHLGPHLWNHHARGPHLDRLYLLHKHGGLQPGHLLHLLVNQ